MKNSNTKLRVIGTRFEEYKTAVVVLLAVIIAFSFIYFQINLIYFIFWLITFFLAFLFIKERVSYDFENDHLFVSNSYIFSDKIKKQEKINWKYVDKISKGIHFSGIKYIIIEFYHSSKDIKIMENYSFIENKNKINFDIFVKIFSEFLEERKLPPHYNKEFKRQTHNSRNIYYKQERQKYKKIEDLPSSSNNVKMIPDDEKLNERKPIYGFTFLFLAIIGGAMEFYSDRPSLYQIFLVIVCFTYSLRCFLVLIKKQNVKVFSNSV